MGRRSFPRQDKLKFIVERIIGGSPDGEIQDALTEYGPFGRVKRGEYGAYGEVGLRTIANIRLVVELTREQVKEDKVVSSPWVQEAQRVHLFGVEERAEWGGLNTVTYKEVGVRQHLEFLKGCFRDIDPKLQSFWDPLVDHDTVMTELHGHLPDETFWSQVKDFIEKSKQCEALLGAAYGRFTSAGEQLAPLEPIRGPTPPSYITSVWSRQAAVLALGPALGIEYQPPYDHMERGDWLLICEQIIYRGPNNMEAERRHRELVENFRETQEFDRIVELMKELRDLRQQIMERVNQCLQNKEYVLSYCPFCPIEQAHRKSPD